MMFSLTKNFVLVSLALFVCGNVAVAQETILFYDNFESDTAGPSMSPDDLDPVIGLGDIGGNWVDIWENVPQGLQVVNDAAIANPPITGNNFLRLNRITEGGLVKGNFYATGWDAAPTEAAGAMVRFSCSLYMPSLGASTNSTVVVNGPGAGGGWADERGAGFNLYGDGHLTEVHNWPGPVEALTAVLDQWQEVSMLIDMDNQVYNLTVGSSTVEDIPLFSAPDVKGLEWIYLASGLNESYFFVDNVQLSVTGGPFNPLDTNDFTWRSNNLGDWNSAANWELSGGPPNQSDHTALFPDSADITGPTTVVTNTAVTVNRIKFDNATHSYAVAGLGSVNLAFDPDDPIDPDDAFGPPSLSVTGTHEFQAPVNFINDTGVDVAGGSTLTFNNALNLNGNTLTKTGAGTLAINNILTSVGGTLNCDEGVCSGSGTIGGNVNNSGGTISPGNSPGFMAIEGAFSQGEGGRLLVELGGNAEGTEYDVLQVDGEATLAGTLEVTLLDGFEPSLGDTFDILDFGSISGDFDEVILADLAGTLQWKVSGLLSDGIISVVPEPTSIALLALGVLTISSRRGARTRCRR